MWVIAMQTAFSKPSILFLMVFLLSIAEVVLSGKWTFFCAELFLMQQFVAFWHLCADAIIQTRTQNVHDY